MTSQSDRLSRPPAPSHRQEHGPSPAEPFYWRALTSFVVIAGFTMIALSGVVLYVTPPGRIANWAGWTLAGLTRTQWQSLHMVFALAFLVASAFHLYFNWRALLSYLRTRVRGGLRRRRELGWAATATVALAVFSAAEVPPVSLVYEGREAISDSWSTATTEPPIPHLELLSVSALAGTLKLDERVALDRLTAAGVAATGADTLADLAERAGRTPRDLYLALAPGSSASSPSAVTALGTAGLGSRTLAEVAASAEMRIDVALERLRHSGIEATSGETLREIASRAGKRPLEIASLLGIAAAH